MSVGDEHDEVGSDRVGRGEDRLRRRLRRPRTTGPGGARRPAGSRTLTGDVLDTALVDVEVQPVRVVRPRAPRTVEPAGLVVHHTKSSRKPSTGSPARSSTFPTLRAAPRPAAGWSYSWRVVVPRGRGAPEGVHARYRAELRSLRPVFRRGAATPRLLLPRGLVARRRGMTGRRHPRRPPPPAENPRRLSAGRQRARRSRDRVNRVACQVIEHLEERCDVAVLVAERPG
jgi:hypothetical protein